MHLDHAREQHKPTWQSELSLAYLLAVTSTAGVSCEFTRVDVFGIDAMLTTKVPGADEPRPRLEVQVKSWTAPEEHGGYFRYPLDVRNYNELVLHSKLHSILVLFVMPPSREEWFEGTDEQGTIRHCAYWTSLQGEPTSENASTKTVYVPKQDQFSVETLSKMMARIASGGDP